MRKRLTQWMIAGFVPLLLAFAFVLTEWSFSLSMQREQNRAQMEEGLIARQVRQTIAELDYTALNEAAKQYRHFYTAQGIELLFLYHRIPIGGARLPDSDYNALLTGQRCAMLDATLQQYGIAEPLTSSVTLLVLRDLSDLYALRSRMRQICLLAALVGALFIAVLSWLLATGFTHPLRRFTQAVTALGKGAEIPEELPRSRKDEIGALATAFEQMRISIQEREQALLAQADSLQALLDALAHEMRTPLCALLGNARLLQNDALPPEKRNALAENMVHEIKRLSDMDAQLMKLTQLRHDPIQKQPVSMRSVLLHTASRLQAQANGVSLLVADGDCTLEADAALLSLLCDNVTVNALHASRPGQTVTLRALSNGFFVQDEGVGMTAEQLAHACEPFYMGDQARTRKAGGAGLGLSLCDRIARLHGGTLTLKSQPGHGTAVIFTISLQPVADSVTTNEVSCFQEVDEP